MHARGMDEGGTGGADGGDCHFECMYVNGSRDVTIRGSKFRDCALYDIFVENMQRLHAGKPLLNEVTAT